VFLWGGGGGGASGRKGTSASSSGGGGGGSGGSGYFAAPSSFFGSTESYTIGASAGGAVAQTVDATNGNNGTTGGNTTFGNMIAVGGAAGQGGGTSSGINGVGGRLNTSYAISSVRTNPCGAGRNTAGDTTAAVITFSPTGGGGGGYGDTITARSGGSGGAINNSNGVTYVAGGTAGIETGTLNGGNGNPSVTSGGALKQANIAPDAIDYVEAHGTGTPLGDPVEVDSLGAVFKGRHGHPLQLGAVKTNLGHLEAAAGMAGLIKVLFSSKV